jgi:hypothetical protein
LKRRGWWILGLLVLAILAAGAWPYRDDILATTLDPKIPFQLYRPAAAPDYTQRNAWALYPQAGAPTSGADVFFIHPTTYDGGAQWLGPIPHERTDRILTGTMLPNYAGPFERVGRIFAPRYRHASLYALMRPHRDDAREAQEFAYDDVRRAFAQFLTQTGDRPFFIVGVEQGGTQASRLIRDEIAPNPAVKRRLVAAYLMETIVPADEYGPNAAAPACVTPTSTHCVMAWASVEGVDLERAGRLKDGSLVWRRRRLVRLEGREPLCVNPMLGVQSEDLAPARLNLGAANATGLEWGARPAFLVRQVTARCQDGLLRVSRPRSSSLRRSGGWSARLMAPGYNLFYANIEADAERRLAAIRPPSPVPPAATQTAPAAPAAPGRVP